MPVLLPERPNLSHLRAQAKDLLAAHHVGELEALNRVRPYFDPASDIGLNDAQLVVAREYGFDSWPRLKIHVELRAGDLSREQQADSLAASALRGDYDAVSAAFAANLGLEMATLSSVCATGRHEELRRVLVGKPEMAREPTGARGWQPLAYVCFSCYLGEPSRRNDLVEAARILLASGADPNAVWPDPNANDYPEPCLYGASGVYNCPELARLLLEAGAAPNDNESLYHSTELPDFACLRLLLDHGADVAHGNALAHLLDREEPDWVRDFLSYAKSPAVIPPVFPHALRRGRRVETFAALIASGTDLNVRDDNGLTPFQSATRLGRTDVADLFAGAGADTSLTPADKLLGRLAGGEAIPPGTIPAEAIRLLDAEPSPELVRQAENGNNAVLETLLAAGADPNVRDSQNTALHQACLKGRLETARILLRFGADPKIKDTVHHADAVGWAIWGSEHGSVGTPGDYATVVESLLESGGVLPEAVSGSPEVRAVLIGRGARAV